MFLSGSTSPGSVQEVKPARASRMFLRGQGLRGGAQSSRLQVTLHPLQLPETGVNLWASSTLVPRIRATGSQAQRAHTDSDPSLTGTVLRTPCVRGIAPTHPLLVPAHSHVTGCLRQETGFQIKTHNCSTGG